jgi:hypothetical protein
MPIEDLLQSLTAAHGLTQTVRSLLAMFAHWGEPAVPQRCAHGKL